MNVRECEKRDGVPVLLNLKYQRILPSCLWEVKGTLGSTAGQLCGEARPELRSSTDGAESEV